MSKFRIDLYFAKGNLWRQGKVLTISDSEADDMYKRMRDAKPADGIRLVRLIERIQESRTPAGVEGGIAGMEL